VARPKSEDKRNAILDAATRLFAERGLAAAPTSEISNWAGVAEGTLFTYFRPKDDLINSLYRKIQRPRTLTPQQALSRSVLPAWLPDLTVRDLRIGKHILEIRFYRNDDRTEFEVLKGGCRNRRALRPAAEDRAPQDRIRTDLAVRD
jgi:AcrR family transcriptional regulator